MPQSAQSETKEKDSPNIYLTTKVESFWHLKCDFITEIN